MQDPSTPGRVPGQTCCNCCTTTSRTPHWCSGGPPSTTCRWMRTTPTTCSRISTSSTRCSPPRSTPRTRSGSCGHRVIPPPCRSCGRDERVRTTPGTSGSRPPTVRPFATPVDPDTTARLRLGLAVDDVAAIADRPPPRSRDPDADDFRRANGLGGGPADRLLGTGVVGGGWRPALDTDVRDRAVRFVRLAHKTGLAFPDLDLLLRSCCGGTLDRPALRTVAALLAISRSADLPIDVVCSLVAPLDITGLNGTGTTSTLFDRVFNAAPTAAAPVLVPTAPDPATNGRRVLACAGDILAPRNREFRGRVGRALGLADGDLTAIVERFRARSARWPAPPVRPHGHDRGPVAAAPGEPAGHRARHVRRRAVLPARRAGRRPVVPRLAELPGAGRARADGGRGLLHARRRRDRLERVPRPGPVRRGAVDAGAGPHRRGAGGDRRQRPGRERPARRPAHPRRRVPRGRAGSEVFRSDRFGERAAEVVHDIVVDNGDGVVSSRTRGSCRSNRTRRSSPRTPHWSSSAPSPSRTSSGSASGATGREGLREPRAPGRARRRRDPRRADAPARRRRAHPRHRLRRPPGRARRPRGRSCRSATSRPRSTPPTSPTSA